MTGLIALDTLYIERFARQYRYFTRVSPDTFTNNNIQIGIVRAQTGHSTGTCTATLLVVEREHRVAHELRPTQCSAQAYFAETVGWEADLWSCIRTGQDEGGCLLSRGLIVSRLCLRALSLGRVQHRHRASTRDLTSGTAQVDHGCHEPQISGRGCGLISQSLKEGSAQRAAEK